MNGLSHLFADKFLQISFVALVCLQGTANKDPCSLCRLRVSSLHRIMHIGVAANVRVFAKAGIYWLSCPAQMPN